LWGRLLPGLTRIEGVPFVEVTQVPDRRASSRSWARLDAEIKALIDQDAWGRVHGAREQDERESHAVAMHKWLRSLKRFMRRKGW
jgi:hypothetical protein